MIIEIKYEDDVLKLLELLNAKIIKPDKYERILSEFEKKDYNNEKVKAVLPSVMDLTFDEFIEMTDVKTDEEMLRRYEAFAGIRPSHSVGSYLSKIVFLRNELKSVKKAFDFAKMPNLTDLEITAGFGRMNFGYFGIVDMLACRQGVSDDVILNMKLKNVIGKLTIIANKAKCEKMLTELIKQQHRK